MNNDHILINFYSYIKQIILYFLQFIIFKYHHMIINNDFIEENNTIVKF